MDPATWGGRWLCPVRGRTRTATHRTERSQRLSYSELGRKTHTSSSTLHRYCTGKTVPPDYHTVARIAAACEATDNDLVALLRHWRMATDPDVVPAASDPVPAPRPRWPRVLASAAAALLMVVTFLAAATGSQPQLTSAAQQIHGPSWHREQVVNPALFGVTASSSSGVMPAFRIGSLRFWDSRTRWASLQRQPGVYDWNILDRLVAGAQNAGLPATLVFGGTPGWAAPNGPKAPYEDGSRSAPPDDLTYWDRFISTLVARYRGRIEAYEVWVHANDPRYYSGSTETLVEMTRRASQAIKAADPKAVVVCPSMARLWTPEGQRVLRRFAELRGYDHCDAAGIKLHQSQASDPPETVLEVLQQTNDALHDAGVHPAPTSTTGAAAACPSRSKPSAVRPLARRSPWRNYNAGCRTRLLAPVAKVCRSTCRATCGNASSPLRQLDGTSKPVRGGDTITVSETPQLIVHHPG